MPLDPICSIPHSVRICIPTIPPGLRTSFSPRGCWNGKNRWGSSARRESEIWRSICSLPMRSISIFACTALSARTKTAIRWKRRRLNRALFTKTSVLPWRRSPSATAHSKATAISHNKRREDRCHQRRYRPARHRRGKGQNCDILLHEVEYAAGIAAREPKWQKYHREVHTLSTDLAEVAKKRSRSCSSPTTAFTT